MLVLHKNPSLPAPAPRKAKKETMADRMLRIKIQLARKEQRKRVGKSIIIVGDQYKIVK